MANGEIIQEVKELLKEEGAIKQSTALRLILTLQTQTYEKMQAQADRQAELERMITEQEKRIKKQEDTNIVMWAQNNPKLFIFLVTVYLIVASLVNIPDVIARAIGLN